VIDSASAVFMSLQNDNLCEHLNSPNVRIGMLVRPKWLRDTALIGLRAFGRSTPRARGDSLDQSH
jgi:hypothetical protein